MLEKKHGSGPKTVGGWIWHYCCSIKVALTLLILLALASIVGTLIAQEAPAKLMKIYQPNTVHLLVNLGLNDVYSSWWFVTMLSLFIVNLTCCSWERFFPTWKLITRPREIVTLDFLRARKESDEFVAAAEISDLAAVTKVIKRHGYTVRIPEAGSLYATKGRWSRIGYIVTHISIIMVVIGAVIGKMNGFKGFMEIQEGQATPWFWNRTINHEDKFNFALRLDKLELEYYPPEFYLHVTDLATRKLLAAPKVALGAKFNLPSTKVEAQVVDYRPDFRRENLRDYTANPDFPAILVKYLQNGQEIESGWVTLADANFPSPSFAPNLRITMYNLYTERPKDYKSHLTVIDNQGKLVLQKTIEVNDPLRYQGVTFYQSSFDKENRTTGLQVAKDPGVPIVYIFCTTMILGVMLSFYLSHRQLWLKVEKTPRGLKIMMAGLANRNPLGFRQEYDKILARLKASAS